MTQIEKYNKTTTVIVDRQFLEGKYCSYRAAYGAVISALDESDASTHIDEGLYFMALVKLNIIEKGKLLKDGFIPNKLGKPKVIVSVSPLCLDIIMRILVFLFFFAICLAKSIFS